MISLAKLLEPSPTITRGAFIISFVAAVGSFLGILKNSLLGTKFGAGTELDLYFAAFRIPDFLYNIFIFSTLSSSFLPIFSDLIAQGKDRLWEMVSSLMVFFAVVLAVCAAAVFLFADDIVAVLAPGLSFMDLGRLAVLVRVLMLQPIILAISNVVAMTLQGFKRFFVSSCAPIFYNVGIIFGISVFTRWWGIMGVAYGVLLGAFFHLLIQLPSLRRLGFRFRVAFRRSWESLKQMLVLMLPRSLALLSNNIISLWVVSVSSLLAPGSLAIFDLANTIQGLPQTVFALSLITASFPFLSSSWSVSQAADNSNAKKDFFALFERTAANLSAMMIPLAIAMAVFAPAIVRVILGYGNFSLSAQANTSLALALFALGLPFQSLLMFLIRVFFAMKNTKAPLYSVVAVSVVMIPLIWILGLRFGAPGIAAAMSAGALINTVALWLAFKKEAAGQRFPLLVLGARQGLIIGIFACLPSGVVYHALDFWLKDSGWWAFVFQIMVTALVGFISMFIAFYVLKIASIRDFRLSKFVPKAKHESG